MRPTTRLRQQLITLPLGVLAAFLVLTERSPAQSEDEGDGGSPAALQGAAEESDGPSQPGESTPEPGIEQASAGPSSSARSESRQSRNAAPSANNSRSRFNNPGFRNGGNRRNRDFSRDSGNRQGGNRGSRNSEGSNSSSTGTNSPSSGFAAYRMITDRNIFDTSRAPRTPRSREDTRRPARTDSLTLVGTISSDKGRYAFFDGSSAEFRKVLAPGKSIAGYEIAEIGNESVKLNSGTNSLELLVGGQMRRNEEHWTIVSGAVSARASLATGALTSASEGDEDEVAKRMMQQRASELK